MIHASECVSTASFLSFAATAEGSEDVTPQQISCHIFAQAIEIKRLNEAVEQTCYL